MNHLSVRPALKSIFLPNSLTIIPAHLFWDFTFLEVVLFETGAQLDSIQAHAFRHAKIQQITIPGSVRYIGWSSFGMCAQLESVNFELPSRLNSIREYAFRGCAIREIVLPPSVTFISNLIFCLPRVLRSISISPGECKYDCESCLIKDMTTRTVVAWVGTKKRVMIPCSMEVIGEYCFFYAPMLESISFEKPSRLRVIENSGFAHLRILCIVFPASLEIIGKKAFDRAWTRCVKFEPGSVLQRIEEYAFYECPLIEMVIPRSTAYIGEKAFGFLGSRIVLEANSLLREIPGSARNNAKASSCHFL
jgi:hypothetical protein